MIKRKSTVYSSQTVFHNVCSEHTVLFLSLCNVDSKEHHRATTYNRDSTGGDYCTHRTLMVGRDGLLVKMIQWLGLFRSISLSFA